MSQGQPDAPARRIFTWKRLLLGGCIVVLLIMLWIAMWIRGVATQRYAADIATLVPADMALVLEARNLRSGRDEGGLADIVAFGEALVEDPGWDTAQNTRAMADLIGTDPDTGRARNLKDTIDNAVRQVRGVQIPVGDSIFGPLDLEDDFLSGDIVVAVRPSPDDESAKPLEEGKEPAEAVVLVRVSGRIKVYASLDSWVPSSPNLKLQFAPAGYTTLTVNDKGKAHTVYYALIGDVFALATTETLIRDVAALGKSPGRTGESLFESPLYAEAVGAAVTAAGSKEAVTSATARVFTNQDALRRLAKVDEVFDDMWEGMKEKSWGEFVGTTGEDMLQTIVDPRAIRASLTLLTCGKAMGSGPTIVADTAFLYEPERMPVGLHRTFEHGGATSYLYELAGGTTFAAVSLGEDIPGLVQQLTGADQAVPMDFLEALSGPGYLGDEIGLLLDKPSMAEREPSDAYPPRLIFAFRLSAGGLQASENPEMLAELAFRNMLPRNSNADRSSAQYLLETHGSHQVVSFFIPQDETNPDRSIANNQVNGILRPFFGPDVDPACAVVRTDHDEIQDGYFLVSTNSGYLRMCLDAWDAGASRLRRLGGVGVAMSYFSSGPAFTRGLFDVQEMLTGYYSPEGISLASNEGGEPTLLPSEARAMRARADRDAGGAENIEESDRLFNEYKRKRVLELKALRSREVRNALDSRNLWLMLNWFGYQLRPIGKPGAATDRCHLRMVFAFGR